MTWKSESGNEYKLVLLDTNILSEILKHPDVEGRGYLRLFPPSSYAPCFSFLSLIEMRRRTDVFEKFVSFFSLCPIFLLKTFQQILDEERKANGEVSLVQPLLQAFSPLGVNESYSIKHFTAKMFSDPFFANYERNWRSEESEIIQSWLANKTNFHPTKSAPNARDAEEYLSFSCLQSLARFDLDWLAQEIKQGRDFDISSFPSLRVSLYSQYYRLFDPHWKANPQEVTDVLIYSAAPYMDVVISEAFQAEIFKKIRDKIPEQASTEVFTLRDLREKSKECLTTECSRTAPG